MIFDIYIEKEKELGFTIPEYTNEISNLGIKITKAKFDKLKKEQLIIDEYFLTGSIEGVADKYNIDVFQVRGILKKYGIVYKLTDKNDPEIIRCYVEGVAIYNLLKSDSFLTINDIAEILDINPQAVVKAITSFRKFNFLSKERKKKHIYDVDIYPFKIEKLYKSVKVIEYKGLKIPLVSWKDFCVSSGIRTYKLANLLLRKVLRQPFFRVGRCYYYTLYDWLVFMYSAWHYGGFTFNKKLKRFFKKLRDLQDYIYSCIENGQYPIYLPVFVIFENYVDFRKRLELIFKKYGIISPNLIQEIELFLMGHSVYTYENKARWNPQWYKNWKRRKMMAQGLKGIKTLEEIIQESDNHQSSNEEKLKNQEVVHGN